MIKVIVFDLDGTLVDSIMDITAALNNAMGLDSIKKLNIYDVKPFIGKGARYLVEKGIENSGSSKSVDEALKDYLEYYSNNLAVWSRLYPHAKVVLRTLGTTSHLAIISNKKEEFCNSILRKLAIRNRFSLVLGSDSCPSPKPASDPYLRVLEHYNVQPDEVLCVGDSESDILGGKNMGMKTVAAAWGYGQSGFYEGASFLAASLDELVPIKERL